jgi:hypothetical protein
MLVISVDPFTLIGLLKVVISIPMDNFSYAVPVSSFLKKNLMFWLPSGS